MKKIAAIPLRFLSSFLDRVFALLGAGLPAQFPQFFGQYLQRLGGHLDELRLQVAQYEAAAAALGIPLNEYIEEHLHSGLEIFASTGQMIAQLVERLAQMEAAFSALIGASPISRWWVFISRADWSIALQTWRNFTPGVPTTVEGLIYAAGGLLMGWGLYTLLRALAEPLFKCRLRHGDRS
ncbi:MAG: DUF2937 family protein [Bacillota bacterium]